jgi:transposase
MLDFSVLILLIALYYILTCGRWVQLLARRWVVERTFAWLIKKRRLVVDYEKLPETSESLIYLAMVHLMLKRLANYQAQPL